MTKLIKHNKLGLFLVLIVLIVCGCSKSETAEPQEEENYFRFAGELLSIVDQKGNEYSKEIGSKYTVTVVNNSPEMDMFREYRQSNQTGAEHFHVTDRTRIYKQLKDNEKQTMDIAELETNRGMQIEYWVKPMDNHPHELEAVEIMLKIPPQESASEDSLPKAWHGDAEDEAVSVRLTAELDADQQQYKTTVTFKNKSEKSVEIMADCGLFFSGDNFAPKTEICPAVESMLVRKQKQETQTVYLPVQFFEPPYKVIFVKYRQDQNVKVLHLHLSGRS